MTNGEKIREVFPNARIGYHKATDLVDEHVTVFINGCDTCQDYSMEWWNAEYKEPTTKNDLGVDLISRNEVLNRLASIAKIKAKSDAQKSLMGRCIFMVECMPSVTSLEPRIITCSECKYYRNKGNKNSYCTKRLNVESVIDRYREPNFYCADAVLREVEEWQTENT